MCQKLPYKDFKFCKDLRYINQKFIKNYNEESSEKEFILEVDIEYSNYDGTNKRLIDLVKRVKKGNKENKNKKFIYTDTSLRQYDFNKYRNLESVWK